MRSPAKLVSGPGWLFAAVAAAPFIVSSTRLAPPQTLRPDTSRCVTSSRDSRRSLEPGLQAAEVSARLVQTAGANMRLQRRPTFTLLEK